jgi:hypothetical protein
MKQRITLSLDESNIKYAKKYAKEKNGSVSEIFAHYIETLRQIDEANKKRQTKDPFIEKFAGIFNSGSKDILKETFGK